MSAWTPPIGFLTLPAPGDPTAETLATRLRTVAFKRAVGCDRRNLSPVLAARLQPLQARWRAEARDDAARARLAERFGALDVQTAALALDAPPPIADDAAALLLDEIERREPNDTAAYHRVTAALPALRLATVDRNPLRTIEAHPDKHGNAIDLGGRTPAAWTAALSTALDAIEAALPALHAELATTLRRIVPVGVDDEAHLSCSYREAPGLVYLSLHPSPLTMAEAIVHETQHGKLHLLSWIDPVLENAPDERVASPARPDLRPLFGVLLAAHAFVPVAALHAGLAAIDHPIAHTGGFAARRARVLDDNARALATLREHARPTPAGARVVAALEEIHGALVTLS